MERIERERIAWVFGLTGGELADEGDDFLGNDLWYEGVPEYAKEDVADLYDEDVEYRTVLRQNTARVKHAATERDGWSEVIDFRTSGETECPCTQSDEQDQAECPLCGGDGTIYIGDGWAEHVFRRKRRPAALEPGQRTVYVALPLNITSDNVDDSDLATWLDSVIHQAQAEEDRLAPPYVYEGDLTLYVDLDDFNDYHNRGGS